MDINIHWQPLNTIDSPTDEERKKTKIDAMPQNKILFKLLYNKTTLNLILKHLKLKWDIIKLTLLTLFTSKDRLHELV